VDDEVGELPEGEKVRRVQALSGEMVDVPVDDQGEIVVFWLDTITDVPSGAIRNAAGQVLTTAVKQSKGYVTVPVGADRTPLEAPIAASADGTA